MKTPKERCWKDIKPALSQEKGLRTLGKSPPLSDLSFPICSMGRCPPMPLPIWGPRFPHSPSAASYKARSPELPCIQVTWDETHWSFPSRTCFPTGSLCARQNGNQRDWTLLSKEQLGRSWEALKPREGKSKAHFEDTLCEAREHSMVLAAAWSSLWKVIYLILGAERGCVRSRLQAEKANPEGKSDKHAAICLSDNWHKNAIFPSPLELFGCFKENLPPSNFI